MPAVFLNAGASLSAAVRFAYAAVASVSDTLRAGVRISGRAWALRGVSVTFAAVLVSGCSALGSLNKQPTESNRMARYDLGAPMITDGAPDGVQVSPVGALMAPPSLKILMVGSPAALDNDRIVYRLSYADPNEAFRYEHSRWTSTPAQLLSDRLRARMAREVRVLDASDPDRAPQLKVELLDFSQRFEAPRSGHGVVVVRASLRLANGMLVGQRDFAAESPCATADAAGGAAAISAAADMALGELEDWVAQRAWVVPTPSAMPASPLAPATMSKSPAITMPASAPTPTPAPVKRRPRFSPSGAPLNPMDNRGY